MDMNFNSVVKLNNDVEMPILGLGTWKLRGSRAFKAVLWALELGYRLIDTASLYGNEQKIGEALKMSGIPREEIFITTKVWNSEQGYEKTLNALEQSLNKLQTDYVDLYLIHWPVSNLRNDTWKALEKLYKEGKAHSIGVSNFTINHLEELLGTTEVVPALNQFELSPFLYQKDLIAYCQNKSIVVEAYSGLTRGRKFSNSVLQEIGEKHNKNPAHILIRWGLQHKIVQIPKTGKKEHLAENANVFNFTLDGEDMKLLDNLNEDFRTIDDPHKMR
ncbi:MAG: aldo/keto reductase [Promethearchaeota archaeon]